MSRATPPRRSRGSHSGPAGPDEYPSCWHTSTLEELELRYGSLEDAGERYRELRERGGADFWEAPLDRAPIFWVTEPDVPDDLRRDRWPADREPCWVGLLPRADQERIQALVEGRREWLLASGLASAEEIQHGERYRHLRPST